MSNLKPGGSGHPAEYYLVAFEVSGLEEQRVVLMNRMVLAPRKWVE